MNISVFGLGHVGCVGLGCLAELGHNLIGVDVSKMKVELINTGKATIVEKGIDEIINKHVISNKIVATQDIKYAIENTTVAIVCVGTPNTINGHLDMSVIKDVASQIGANLKYKKEFFTVAIRSTVMPGTNFEVCKIIENTSGKINGVDFSVVSNPEFLREGSAVQDFFNPPYTIIASTSEHGFEVMRSVYKGINGEIIMTDIGSAEMIKFVNNSYHGLKVAFANEIGRICKSMNIDSRKLMNLFVNDKILNISEYYFKPGFSYGGSCLPKDLKALNTIAHDNYLEFPILASIQNSNLKHTDHALNLIMKREKREIGLFGLSFKTGTDDLRFSPALEVAEKLIGKGYNLKIYDKNVSLAKLNGKNKEFLFDKLPHIDLILVNDLNEFLYNTELIVLINLDDTIGELLSILPNNIEIIDFIGIPLCHDNLINYEGICW